MGAGARHPGLAGQVGYLAVPSAARAAGRVFLVPAGTGDPIVHDHQLIGAAGGLDLVEDVEVGGDRHPAGGADGAEALAVLTGDVGGDGAERRHTATNLPPPLLRRSECPPDAIIASVTEPGWRNR